VVIDEVSGQHLALLLGSALPIWWRTTNSWAPPRLGFITNQSALGWKYLLLGFIFSPRIRQLKAVSRAASGVASRRLGHHGRRLDSRRLRGPRRLVRARVRILMLVLYLKTGKLGNYGKIGDRP